MPIVLEVFTAPDVDQQGNEIVQARILARLELFMPPNMDLGAVDAQRIHNIISGIAADYALAPGEVMQPL